MKKKYKILSLKELNAKANLNFMGDLESKRSPVVFVCLPCCDGMTMKKLCGKMFTHDFKEGSYIMISNYGKLDWEIVQWMVKEVRKKEPI